MQNKKLIEIIENPMKIGKKETENMQINLQTFPYFSSMQLLYSKGLYNTDSILYNRQLKIAAAYAADRKLLFKLITQNVRKKERIPDIKMMPKKRQEEMSKKELEIGKPLQFTKNETHSFSEWLSLTKSKKIQRKDSKNQENLIDQFIEETPIICKPKKEKFFSPVQSAKESLIENNEIITETLARVYLEQGYYDKSIAAYDKLSLKYPQKNSFFANQIKLINELKEK